GISGDMALGALQAVKARGKLGKVLVSGFNGVEEAVQEVYRGNMVGTVLTYCDEVGRHVVLTALDVVNKRDDPDQYTVDTGTIPLDTKLLRAVGRPLTAVTKLGRIPAPRPRPAIGGAFRGLEGGRGVLKGGWSTCRPPLLKPLRGRLEELGVRVFACVRLRTLFPVHITVGHMTGGNIVAFAQKGEAGPGLYGIFVEEVERFSA
ncbi:MAG: hypothetical protein ACE5LX_09555, partial [Nitrospinota bacterium]